jgi:uncharacterized protein Yka (UPF0111/DUF47 family)
MKDVLEMLNRCLTDQLESVEEVQKQIKGLESRADECRKDVEKQLERVEELRTAIRALGGEPKK